MKPKLPQLTSSVCGMEKQRTHRKNVPYKRVRGLSCQAHSVVDKPLIRAPLGWMQQSFSQPNHPKAVLFFHKCQTTYVHGKAAGVYDILTINNAIGL